MSSIWTVAPETVGIDLDYVVAGESNPFTIRIKKMLTVGEKRRMETAGWQGLSTTKTGDGEGDATIGIDWKKTGFARMLAYLVDWTLADADHRRLPLTLDTLEAMNEAVYALIEDAITRHVEALEQEKKLTAGKPKPATT